MDRYQAVVPGRRWWLVVMAAWAVAFAATWWVSEVLAGLDREVAITIASALGSLVITPLVWWARQPAATGPSSPATRNGDAPLSTVTATGPARGAVVVVVIVVLACFAVPTLAQFVAPLLTSESDLDSTEQSVEVNKTAWYAGFELTIVSAAYSPAEQEVTIEGKATNLGTRNMAFDRTPLLSVGGQHYDGSIERVSTIPSAGWADVRWQYVFVALEEELPTGILTFGDDRVAKVVVPLGEGELVTFQPRELLNPGTFDVGGIRLAFHRCELSSAVLDEYEQAPADHLVLACWFDATRIVGDTRWLNDEHLPLRTPDGNVLAPSRWFELFLYSLNAREFPNNYLAYFLKEPVRGTYTLQVIDSENPTNVKDVVFAL